MYEVKEGPAPVQKKGPKYPLKDMKVGSWFFVPGKKPQDLRPYVYHYRKRKGEKEKGFTCTAATVDGVAGVVCERTV